MLSLATISLIFGAVCIAGGIALLARPEAVRGWLAAFPRNRPAAWILTAVALAGVAWIVYHARLGRFDSLKPWIWLAGPVSLGLIVVFVDELLAPRALGGLLLLAANPMLQAARVSDSPWSVVVSAFTYVLIVAGIAWMLGPYRFRRWTTWLTSGARARVTGAVLAAAGLLLAGLSVTVY
jgi:hypothetical protein